MANRHQDYITTVRTNAKAIWNAQQALIAAQQEWNALDYGTTLTDGIGENAGITKVMVGAVAFDTANAIKTLLESGHATNIAKLL